MIKPEIKIRWDALSPGLFQSTKKKIFETVLKPRNKPNKMLQFTRQTEAERAILLFRIVFVSEPKQQEKPLYFIGLPGAWYLA